MKLFLIIVFLALLMPSKYYAISNNEGIYFHSLSSEAGLSQTTVQCMFQDSRGFIWFGTQDGLNRYDGYHIEVFRNDENDSTSISSNFINNIIEDKNGLIWIGTDNGLNYYDYNTGFFTSFLKTGDSLGVTHQKVSALYIDEQDRLWVGTEQGVDLYDYKSKTFKNYDCGKSLFNHRIMCMIGDGQGKLWIGALGTGLVIFDPADFSYKIFNSKNQEARISDNRVTTILRDSNNRMWVGTKNGLNIYDRHEQVFKEFGKDIYPGCHLSNYQFKCLAEDPDGNILIGTNEGYNIFNPETKEVQIYNQKSNAKGNLNHFFIYSLLVDRANTVWVGTFYGGVNYYNNTTQNFKYYNPASGTDYIFGTVGPMVEEGNAIWAGTGGGGLMRYDLNTNEFEHYLIDKEDAGYFANQVRAMCKYNGKLLIGTNTGKLLLYDQHRKSVIKNFAVPNVVQYLYEDKKGNAWICFNEFNSLRMINGKTGEMKVIYGIDQAKKKIGFSHVRCILEDSADIYWIGTRYVGLFRYDLRSGETIHYPARKEEPDYLQTNNINELFIDTKNNLWVGTEGTGIAKMDRQTGKIDAYCEEEGLLNRNVMGILEDKTGALWISSLSGISRFDQENRNFNNYPFGNGFPLNEMSNKSYLKLSDGQLVFGGINGLVLFSPERIKRNEFKPPVIISEFRLFHSKKGNDLRKYYLDPPEHIKLNYDKSSFIVNYTGLNYIFPHNNQYAYMLEGFDHGWNYVGDQRVAIYTNLPAGDYTFRVKASNNDGVWNEEGASLSITVLPPFWQTWWAYLIYLAVMSGVFFSFLKYVRLENKIKIKQLEQQNMEKAHQLRIRMFTNFSHELRTPLSLIIGPLEDLLARADLSQIAKESLQLIYKNSQRLLLLVNQLMDFRKQESGHLQLKAAKGDFIKYSEEIVLLFNETAKKRRIAYAFKAEVKEASVWFDKLLFEKVYLNLLSNAFKYTPDEGSIEVNVSILKNEDLKNFCADRCQSMANMSEQYVHILVKDSGKGIPPAEREHIFDPFFQAQNNDNSPVGTGIGLSLTKGIVELHYGKIWLDEQNGEGSTFRVIFPAGPEHLKAEEKVTEPRSGEDHSNYNYVDDIVLFEEEEAIEPETNRNKHSVLIVEDNKAVRQYIKQHLWNKYVVFEATNGEEGLDRALRYLPDLIISDVMMPKMDGLQLCRRLKNDIHTSHIPVILLTARATFQQFKEGIATGADDYLSKPFNASKLLLKAASLIENRERLKKLYEKKSSLDILSSELPSMDDRFMKKVYEIIDQHISDADFNIEKFSEEIGMSRANLYRKVKSLTNQSPNEFIKDLRLRIAVKYLRESSLTISEISYKAGFNSPAYFTNCFKKAYGVSPTEFLDQDQQHGTEIAGPSMAGKN